MLTAQESNFRDAVVDAAGELCLTNAIVATNFVKTTKTVVFTAADSALRGRGESQVVALHALANVFGAERGEQEILDDEAESHPRRRDFRSVRLKIFRRHHLHRLGEQERPFRQPSRRRLSPPVHRGPSRAFRRGNRRASLRARRPRARRRARPRRRARARRRALAALAAADVADARARDLFRVAAAASPLRLDARVARAVPDVLASHRQLASRGV